MYAKINKPIFAGCVLSFSLATLLGSLYWEQIHLACVVTAALAGLLTSWLFSSRNGGLRMAATMTNLFPMMAVKEHFHVWAVFFQYLGIFYIVFTLGLFLFEDRVAKRSGPVGSDIS